uniref:Ovule protein n=1 Tax=Romanomermis culicivorax TaxID=13658 RepID=A0A915L844_ROMCU
MINQRKWMMLWLNKTEQSRKVLLGRNIENILWFTFLERQLRNFTTSPNKRNSPLPISATKEV